jgi:tryptophan-rich sensory protein
LHLITAARAHQPMKIVHSANKLIASNASSSSSNTLAATHSLSCDAVIVQPHYSHSTKCAPPRNTNPHVCILMWSILYVCSAESCLLRHTANSRETRYWNVFHTFCSQHCRITLCLHVRQHLQNSKCRVSQSY